MLNDRECKINTFFKLRLRKGNDALMFPFNMVIITSTKKKKKKMGQILIFKNILALHFYNSVFSSVKWRNYRDNQL